MPHYFAQTKDGKLVTATEAQSGVDHFCVICKATMRARKCTNMVDHFFLFHDAHKSRDCMELEKESGVIRKPGLLNRNKFLQGILNPKHRGEGNGGGGGSTSPGRQMRPPNSLRQLIASGVRLQDPFSPITDGGILSDVFVGKRSYAHCIHTGEDLNPRAIDVRLWSARNGKITYTATWVYKNQKFRAFFIQKVSDEIDFEGIADSLFHVRRTFKGNDSWHEGKYKLLAVVGNWKAITKDECKKHCGWCKKENMRICLGMWESELKHEGQMYYSDLPDNQVALNKEDM